MSLRFMLMTTMVATSASSFAASPAWWALRGATNSDPADDHAAVNQGQLKHFTRKAVDELNAAVPGGAGTELESLVQDWIDGHPDPDDSAAMNVGQLKWIAARVHARLIHLCWEDAAPSWLAQAPGDTQLANLGQLKAVFNFDLSAPVGQLPRWWEKYYFGDVIVDTEGNTDGDWLSNLAEYQAGTNPLDKDSDDDAFADGFVDTDGDGLADQWELLLIEQKADPSAWNLASITAGGDEDGDGVSNFQEHQLGFSGYQSDSDGDGYSDGLSVNEEVFLRLDESSGISAEDSSGKARDGALAGSPEWLPTGGIEGGALEFHGGSDALALSKDVLDGAGDLTVSLWFKTSSSPSGQTLLSSAEATQAPEFAITLEGGNTVRLHVGGGNAVAWTYGRSLADGRWHQLVVTRDVDVATGQATLFVDGAAFGASQGISPGLIGVDAVVLGQRHQSVSSFDPSFAFTGILDNVRIHSEVLGAERLAELFRPNDLDADHLPDDWEFALSGDLATLDSSDHDLDGDGLGNRLEYEGGTDPTNYYNGVTPQVTLVSGGGQTIYNGQRTPAPLVFKVTTNGTTPLVAAPLLLEHLELIGSIETLDGDTLAPALTLKTDSQGLVKVHFKAD